MSTEQIYSPAWNVKIPAVGQYMYSEVSNGQEFLDLLFLTVGFKLTVHYLLSSVAVSSVEVTIRLSHLVSD